MSDGHEQCHDIGDGGALHAWRESVRSHVMMATGLLLVASVASHDVYLVSSGRFGARNWGGVTWRSSCSEPGAQME